MRNLFFTLSAILLFTFQAEAQFWNGTDSLYGNEWIDFGQTYYKIEVAEDGVYKLSQQDLLNAGIPASVLRGSHVELYHEGEQVPVHVTTNGVFAGSDYLAFYGEKNDGQFDTHLYESPTKSLNTEVSLFNDTSSYFLSFSTGSHKRFNEVTNNLSGLPAKDNYYLHKEAQVFGAKYHKGTPVSPAITTRFLSGFQPAEGYSKGFVGGNLQTFALPVTNLYPSGPATEFEVRLGTWINSHALQLRVDGTTKISDNFYGIDVKSYNFNHPSSSIGSSVSLDIQGMNAGDDRQIVSYIFMTYPRAFDFDNQTSFEFIVESSMSKRYLEINNFNHGGTAPILYDRTNEIFINTTLSGSMVRIALPPSTTNHDLVLVSTGAGFKTPPVISTKNFVDYSVNQGEFIMISSSEFIGPNGGGHIQAYANMRTAAGTPAIIVDVQELYDQFAYGIDRHISGLRNFSHFAEDNWTNAKYLFLVGKGREYPSTRFTIPANLKVPTFGYPPSDNLISAHVGSNVPSLSTGRIAAQSPADLQLYLNKVTEYEAQLNAPPTAANHDWTKRIVHLRGGDDVIRGTIESYMNDYRGIAEDPRMGAEVIAFENTPDDVLTTSPSEQLVDVVNEGVSFITFFGHSSSFSFDYSLNPPEEFDNQGKYFTLMALGCNAGNLHVANRSISEDYVLIADKGAVTYLSTVSLSNLPNLNVYADAFYKNMAITNFGEGIGTLIKQTIADTDPFYNFATGIINQGMTLHGDPSITMYQKTGVDYAVNGDDTQIEPNVLAALATDVDLTFDVCNIGEAILDSFDITVEHIYPDATTVTVWSGRVAAPMYGTTFELNVPFSNPAGLAGNNTFRITVDASSEISETSETNNVFDYDFYVVPDDIKPMCPADNGIVTAGAVNLMAEATGPGQYYWELDTSSNFDSPFLMSTITTPGAPLEWSPAASFIPGQVYYWRVSIDPSSPAGINWRMFSFTYAPGSDAGWMQSDMTQIGLDDMNEMVIENGNQLQFTPQFKEIQVQAENWPAVIKEEKALYINGNLSYYERYCKNQGVYFVIVDPLSLDVWENWKVSGSNVGRFNSIHCKTDVFPVFFFDTKSSTSRLNAMNFLENDVPTGHYVVVYGSEDYGSNLWAADQGVHGKNLITELEQQGLNQISSTTALRPPFAGFFRKDMPAFNAEEVYGANYQSKINPIFQVVNHKDEGVVYSPEIGEATSWDRIEWNTSSMDNLATDFYHIELYGIQANGNETLLNGNITTSPYSLSGVSASTYPKLRMEYHAMDTANQSARQLDDWAVYFDGPSCIPVSTPVNVNVTLLLEGAYEVAQSKMRSELADVHHLLPGQINIYPPNPNTPAGQPYGVAPWFYSGDEGVNYTDSEYATIKANNGNRGVVDWVLVELRNTPDEQNVIGTGAGLVLDDGSVIFPEGGNTITFDFTNSDSYTGGFGFGQKQMSDGEWVLFAGDIVQDDVSTFDITGSDKARFSLENGQFGNYFGSDMNMDGDIDGADKAVFSANNGINSGIKK